jgi:hypothetical protein
MNVFGKRTVRVVGPIHDLPGDVLGDVTRPTFGDIERDYPEGVFVLSGDEVPDDGVTIGLGDQSRGRKAL